MSLSGAVYGFYSLVSGKGAPPTNLSGNGQICYREVIPTFYKRFHQVIPGADLAKIWNDLVMVP